MQALFSAYRKTDELAEFARALATRGWNILASSGTVAFLAERGIAATDVATIVGKPILGHRVVTLSREIHAGLLARPEDDAELAELGIRRIDLVYVDLYPLHEEIARPGATEQSVIEKTDIGGPTLLRAAAKGRRIVLSNPSQFAGALAFIDSKHEDKTYLATLASAAEQLAGEYSLASAEAIRLFHRG
jgi:phosphoribosylaminoimidazolecarboxamide formyltransferase/IMP cyclohydrolase